MQPERLAVYGSLAPGQVNHDQLGPLVGTWATGTVRGRVRLTTVGPDAGYPALTLEPNGPLVDVLVFTSKDLARHWERLDEFEGEGYRRVLTTVRTAAGDVTAWVYVGT